MTQRVKGIVLSVAEGAEAANLCASLLFAHGQLRIAANKLSKEGQDAECSVYLRHAALIYDLAQNFL
jgi:hypothetical protein